MEEPQNRKAYMKQYYEENRDRVLQKYRELYVQNKKVIQKMIQNGSIIEVETKKRGRPRKYNDLVIKPKEKKPKKQKTAVIERKRKLIERNLEEIQKRADAFKISLNTISDADKSGESKINTTNQQDV
jgi:hypothetical protein